MTVSPNRPQDVNRRPSSMIQNARGTAKTRSSALPPILFQLPNLNSGSVDEEAVEAPQPAVINDAAEQQQIVPTTESAANEVASAEATASKPSTDESPITRLDAPEENVQASLLERVGTHAVTFGMLGLLAAGTIYVARNVNLEQPEKPAVETSDTAASFEVASLNPTTMTAPNLQTPALPVEVPHEITAPQLAPAHVATVPPAVNGHDLAVQLAVPEMDMELPELPAMKQTEPVAAYKTAGETELQMAERGQQLAEQIAKAGTFPLEDSHQDFLPDAPTEPLQDLNKVVSAKTSTLADKINAAQTQLTPQIPANDKLDEELNAALVSMKAESMAAETKAVGPSLSAAANTVNSDPRLDMQNSISQFTEAAPDLRTGATSPLAGLSSPNGAGMQDFASQNPMQQSVAQNVPQNAAQNAAQKAIHRTTNSPAEADTAIAAILRQGNAAMENFATNSPAPADPNLGNATEFANQGFPSPATPAHTISSPQSTQSSSQYSRTPHAVANWLKYLPTSTKR